MRLLDRDRSVGGRAWYWGKLLIFVFLTWLLCVLYVIFPRSTHDTVTSHEVVSNLPDPAPAIETHAGPPPAAFHLIVPASQPDPNLCKVLVSAAALGYPDPILINWGKTFDDPKYFAGGSHLAKIGGISDYLKALPPSKDDDLVLMIDGYDVWLQLRPQTLIDRYFAINAQADARIAEELGPATEQHHVRQEIVFGVQKRCWPWKPADPPCYAVPYSTLPPDVYGPETDRMLEDGVNPYIRIRPRTLNSGIVMGTVKALRHMFDRAVVMMVNESNFGSDQLIFSHIFGDQEVWREALRRDARTEEQQQVEQLPSYQPFHPWNEKHIAGVRKKAAAQDDGSLEFGIGLDYRMELGINTVFSEDDTAWVKWSKEALHAAEGNATVPDTHPHRPSVIGFPHDVAKTVPPFWTFNNEAALPSRDTNWNAVPLFTNLWTGTIPAVIHHNAHRNGSKILRETWWNETWFFQAARSLYNVHIYEPAVPVAYATVPDQDQRSLREYWPGELEKGGARVAQVGTSTWLRFDEMCTAHLEEVFRDGKGPWKPF